jgi:hypothetical protein
MKCYHVLDFAPKQGKYTRPGTGYKLITVESE